MVSGTLDNLNFQSFKYPYFQTFKLLYIQTSVLSNGFEYMRL